MLMLNKQKLPFTREHREHISTQTHKGHLLSYFLDGALEV